MMTTRSILLALAALVATGCYDAPRPSCAFLCTGNTACPEGYTCAADGWCKRDDVAPTFACETVTVDAAVADAPDVDAAIDAPDVDAPDVDAAPDAPTDAPIDAPTDAADAMLTIITANPVAFGDVVDTTTATLPVMVRNSGGTATSALTVTVTGAGFTRIADATDTCTGATLAAMATCSFNVRFAPDAVAAFTGVAGVSATTGGAASINLTGAGTAALTAASPLAFGGITVNGMSDLPVTFTNGGAATTGTLTTARTGDAQFSIQSDTCNAATVAAAGTCTVTVRFAPLATGAVTGTLTVTGDPGGPVAVQLTGTGQ